MISFTAKLTLLVLIIIEHDLNAQKLTSFCTLNFNTMNNKLFIQVFLCVMRTKLYTNVYSFRVLQPYKHSMQLKMHGQFDFRKSALAYSISNLI